MRLEVLSQYIANTGVTLFKEIENLGIIVTLLVVNGSKGLKLFSVRENSNTLQVALKVVDTPYSSALLSVISTLFTPLLKCCAKDNVNIY